MTDRQRTISSLDQCFGDLQALADSLSDADWQVQSLCPDWTVHGVVSHLAAVENILVGWSPAADDDPPPFQKMGAFTEEADNLSGAELAARLAGLLATRRGELAALDDDDWDQRCMSPIGPATYGRFMDVRVFDFWVHQRDMTLPLGRATNDSGPPAETALDEVHGSLGYIVGKKVGLPDGMSIGFHLTGGLDRDMYVVIDGRAQVVDEIANPDVQVNADSTTFIMLACGRVDPQEQIDAGRISWSGHQEWGEKAARNLRFTM